MSIEVGVSGGGNLLTIRVKGRFDFNLLNEFRQAYSDLGNKQADIEVDMRETESIDSSALGMLLSMQSHLGKVDGDISLVNCSPDVKKILMIVRFDKKFSIK